MKKKFIILGICAFILSFIVALYVTKPKEPNPKAASAHFENGKDLFSRGQFSEAIDAYKEGLEYNVTSVSGYNLLGVAYRARYQQEKSWFDKFRAIRAFKKAHKLDPKDRKSIVNLGVTYYYMGSKKKAIKYLERAIDVDPNDPSNSQVREMIIKAKGETK